MIIDYIGQELIWNLTATHPYKQNRGNYSIMINCTTPKQNKEYVRFFRKHLKKKLKILTKIGSGRKKNETSTTPPDKR